MILLFSGAMELTLFPKFQIKHLSIKTRSTLKFSKRKITAQFITWFTKTGKRVSLHETVCGNRRYTRQRVQFNTGNQRLAGGLFLCKPKWRSGSLKIVLKPKPRIKKLVFEVDMGELAIKGRQSMGNLLTKLKYIKSV
jgi:hypothetical protein